VALVRKVADKIRITIFFSNSSTNELVVTSNKLTNNFAGLVTSDLAPDETRGPPVGPRRSEVSHLSAVGFSPVL
jgi:hypothetical protein